MAIPYNVLIDTPPEICEINGREYKIATDYRVVLAYLRLQEGEEEPEEKAAFGLELFFGSKIAPDDVEELADFLGWFLRCGKEPEDKGPKGPKAFDLLVDSGRIYAAFLQAYRINLRQVRVHWWVFCGLLEGLPKGTHLAEVIEIRGKPFEDWMRGDVRASLAKLKMHYRIEKETEADFGDLFSHL